MRIAKSRKLPRASASLSSLVLERDSSTSKSSWPSSSELSYLDQHIRWETRPTAVPRLTRLGRHRMLLTMGSTNPLLEGCPHFCRHAVSPTTKRKRGKPGGLGLITQPTGPRVPLKPQRPESGLCGMSRPGGWDGVQWAQLKQRFSTMPCGVHSN